MAADTGMIQRTPSLLLSPSLSPSVSLSLSLFFVFLLGVGEEGEGGITAELSTKVPTALCAARAVVRTMRSPENGQSRYERGCHTVTRFFLSHELKRLSRFRDLW